MGSAGGKLITTDNHVRVDHSNRIQPFTLSKRNKKIIRQTWKKISANKIENGVLVFFKLFQIIPDAKQYFTSVEFFNDMKDLIKDPLVRSHGLRFMKAIETMLEIEFDSNGCIFLFSAIGNRHCSYGIEADYLDYVPQAFRFMLTKALGNNYTDKIASVWDEILSHIIKAMQDKVREGRKLKEDKEEVARRISSTYLTDKKREDCKSTTNGSEDSPNVM